MLPTLPSEGTAFMFVWLKLTCSCQVIYCMIPTKYDEQYEILWKLLATSFLILRYEDPDELGGIFSF